MDYFVIRHSRQGSLQKDWFDNCKSISMRFCQFDVIDWLDSENKVSKEEDNN